MTNKKVLILDDEASILDVLTQHLRAQGYDCVPTTSPERALELIAAEKFALLLTDLKMPEMSGNEVVQRAKETDSELAIIVVTALIEVTNAIQAMRSGADDYVLKPFNLNEISIAVSRGLEKRALLIENRHYRETLEARVQAATEDLEQVNHELRLTKEYLESLLHSTVDAILTLSSDGAIEFANRGAEQMLGYSMQEFVGMSAGQLFTGGPSEVELLLRRLRDGRPLQNYETELRHREEGLLVPVNITFSMAPHPGSDRVSALAICKDITEQKRLEQELKEMSIKDSLTNLYNQRYFYDRLRTEIERARRQSHPLSLLLFDIDQFKTYNDCHGHLAGDKVLQTVGEVIGESTRDHVDIGFRYGGDEFTVILPEAGEEQAMSIAERIRRGFEAKRFDQLTLSIGLMSYRDGCSLRNFIQFTDAMMYDAKRSGGNRVFIYNLPDTQLDAADPIANRQAFPPTPVPE